MHRERAGKGIYSLEYDTGEVSTASDGSGGYAAQYAMVDGSGGDPTAVLPPGAVFDKQGRMCNIDRRGRYHQVDQGGIRVTKRGTTRPSHFGEEWWGRARQYEKTSDIV